jgi:hypothetical protein
MDNIIIWVDSYLHFGLDLNIDLNDQWYLFDTLGIKHKVRNKKIRNILNNKKIEMDRDKLKVSSINLNELLILSLIE